MNALYLSVLAVIVAATLLPSSPRLSYANVSANRMRYLPLGASEGLAHTADGTGDFGAGEVPLSEGVAQLSPTREGLGTGRAR